MKTIITTTDFSSSARNANLYAADLAVHLKMELLLLHIVSVPMAFSEVPVSVESFNVIVDDANEEMEKLKLDLIAHSGGKLSIKTKVINGTIIEEIEMAAHKYDGFAVVMGLQGAGATERFLFGSNSLNAIHKLDVPVFIIPEHVQFRCPDNIGLACDIHNIAGTIPTGFVKELAHTCNSMLYVLYIHKPKEEDLSANPAELKILEEQFKEFNPEFHTISNERVEQGISDAVKLMRIDLLVVFPKDYGLVKTIFHKKMSKDLITHLSIPILSIRAVK